MPAPRRGAFGVQRFFREADVAVVGEASRYDYRSDAGAARSSSFCARCGSTLWTTAAEGPGTLAVPIGAFADPADAGPTESLWEQTRHDWVTVPAHVERHLRGHAS